MNQGRWARRHWRVTDFLKVGFIGLGVLFSYSLAFALESSDGTFRITRSDVNGEGAVNADDGSTLFLLQGTIGTVDVGTSSYSSGRHLGGIQGNLYYPTIPTAFQSVSVTSTSIVVNWRAPGAGIKSNIILGNYQLRQRTTPMNQANFDSSTDVPAVFSAITIGNLHPDITVPGLSYNTTYYVGLEALDSDTHKNRSYLTTTSTCTLAAEITGISYIADYPNKKFTVSFNPNNPRSDSLYFEGQLSTSTSFIPVNQIQTRTTTDTNPTSVTLPDFNNLNRNKSWYFRARARNQAGAFTPWYPAAAPVRLDFQNAIPTVTMAASEVYVTSATLRWNVTGLPAGNQYQAEASSDNFVSSIQSPLLPKTTPYYTFTTLDNNQAFKFRVNVFDNNSFPVGLSSEISAVTSVFRPTAVQAFDIFQTSATAIWSWSGDRAHSFKVDVSSISPASGFLSAGPDANNNLAPYPLNSLQINTTYYVKVTALNSNGVPSAQGPSDVAVFVTQAVPPDPIVFMSPPDPRHQISFYWGHNGNNPLSRYRVELSLDSAFSSVVASTDLASGQISHMFENVNSLAPGDPVLANTEHFVRVQTIQASNGFPLNPPVTGSRFTTPLAPVLSSVDKNISALKIHWTDESGTMKNSPATLYSVIFSTPGGVSVDSVSPTTYSMPAEVGTSALLFPNTTYQIQVTALGAIGSGNSSAIASTIAVTLANLPLLTTGLSDIFQSSITVRWSAPGNPPDTSYKVEISTDNAFPLGATSTKSVTGIFHVFNSLVPNRRYSVRISAVNRQGVWTSTDSQDYDTKPAPPLILAFSKPPFTTTAELTLNWDANGNDGATFYATMRPPSNTWILAGQVTNRTFQGLAPNTPYSFEVQARDKNNGRQKDAVSGATTTYTRAEPAPSFEYGNVTDIDTWDIRIASRANDPSTTEYAFQLIASGTPTISFDQQFLVLSAGKAVPSTITYVNDPAVWRTLANWGLPDPGTGRYVISGDFLPSDKHELWVYVRNGDHFVENPSQKLIEPQSGAPRVELTVRGSTITAAQSWLTPIYVNTSTIPFRASGSSHFNILMSSVLSDSTTFAGANGNNYQNVGQGWNGDQKDTAYCSNETAYVDPTYLGPLQGVCGLGEDLFYLHIVGDKMSLGGNPIGPIYPGNPSFRVYVDLIPPLAGTIDARGAGYSIPDNGGTLGFQTIDFSWPVIDGGNPVSRSPIVGWAYSFALNDNTLDPVQSTATHFVAGPAVPGLSLSSLGSVPSTGTYYFKVIGLDQAGNWQPTPTSFTYNFKEDSLPPAFKGVSLVGAKMPKSDFHYAAVDPSAPIRLVFSEPVNLANAGALDFVQTHNALGQRVNTPVSFASSATVVDGSTTYMDVTPTVTLDRGARYEIRSSTWNLRDLGGNPLPANQTFSIAFFTQIDPNARTVFVTLDGGARLEVSANAFGPDPSGVAFDDDVKNDPAPIGATVRGASGAVSRRSGGDYNQVLATKEFNHYAPDGTRLTAPFGAPVTLTFGYSDADGNGIVDGTESGHPVKVDRLAIYALDELSGAWMKLPGSRVDTTLHNVSVELRHFSVYALIGTASFDLTEAHPFPVPYRAAKDTGGIVFSFPNSQIAKVQVFTLDGRLVKTLSDDTGAGFVRWDPVDSDGGDPVASDVYLYVIENDQERKVGKLMVIR